MEPEITDDPLDWGQKPTSFPHIPAEMVHSIALGMEDELVIASRHGFSVEQYQEIAQLKPFQAAVASQRAEFEKSGLTFRLKQAMKADILADEVFVKLMSNETTLVQKLEGLKYFAKVGGLEPKEEKAAPISNLPTIVINTNSISMEPSRTIDIPAKVLTSE
jgi:hypothetical protein